MESDHLQRRWRIRVMIIGNGFIAQPRISCRRCAAVKHPIRHLNYHHAYMYVWVCSHLHAVLVMAPRNVAVIATDVGNKQSNHMVSTHSSLRCFRTAQLQRAVLESKQAAPQMHKAFQLVCKTYGGVSRPCLKKVIQVIG